MEDMWQMSLSVWSVFVLLTSDEETAGDLHEEHMSLSLELSVCVSLSLSLVLSVCVSLSL